MAAATGTAAERQATVLLRQQRRRRGGWSADAGVGAGYATAGENRLGLSAGPH